MQRDKNKADKSNRGKAGKAARSTNAGRKNRRRGAWRTAATSDPHELYELSVQDVPSEVELVDQVWGEIRGRQPSSVREDFCGTAAMSCAWVGARPGNTAIGVDIDQSVLDWGKARFDKRLTRAQQKRLKIVRGDVMTVKTPPVDAVLAMNFSYYLFKTRPLLKKYFKRAHAALVRDGLFLLDAYGGSDSFLEMEEERDLDGFTYIWDQNKYNPITGDVVNHIHFKFPDGTKLKKAFTYEWRLWTLPEIQEILLEAGFRDVKVYWEGTDKKTKEGNGEFSETRQGEACPGWIAYLVAVK
jgi:SAM-dependent methyltransferase